LTITVSACPVPSICIGYAPPLLPDELLYSWLGRLALLNAMGSPRECLARIFGSKTVVPSIDLPRRLLSVQQRLGGWLPFQTTDQLLDSGTLLPYHRPFLTPSRYDSVRRTLLQGDGKGLKTQLGRVANRFGANPSLRLCVECMADSFARHGSPYWMRRHQLPGVNCCTIHGIPLLHLPPLSLRTDRQRFIAPSALIARPNSKADAVQLRFAQLSEELLFSKLPVIDAQRRSVAYSHSVLALGLRSRRGRVDYRGLADAVRRSFKDFDGFDHRERLLATSANPLGWIKDLIERPERSAHPICHLLLIDFLFGSIPAFETACLSQDHVDATTHHQRSPNLPTARDSPADIDCESALRDTSLSCRAVAILLGRSVTTVVNLRRERGIPISERRKSLTPTILASVRSELSSGSALPIVASRCGVSLSTVYRILAEYPALQRPQHVQRLEADTTRRRQRWLTALAKHRDRGVNATRAAAPADYAWLYKHDRSWLTSTTQQIRHAHEVGLRVDWMERDTQLCEQVLRHLATLRNETPPQRITRTRLLRPLGETMVQRNIQCLPMLHALLSQVAESQEAFRVRRVDFAISALASSGGPIQVWRVRRLAGLRIWSDALANHANREIERLNAENSVCTYCLS
jgi:hypothetical protein